VTLEEHARAIEAAIQAAAEDGYFIDNAQGLTPGRLDLNKVDGAGDPEAWVELSLPRSPFD
jgi:hypothetical protein